MNKLEALELATENVNELWLRAINTDDQDALSVLVNKTQRLFMSFLMKKGATIEDAEDVIQVAWNKAWCARNTFNRQKFFLGWMFRVVHNEYVNLLRTKNRKLSLLQCEDFDGIPDISEVFYEPWYTGIEDQLCTDASEIRITVQDTIIGLTRDNAIVLLYIVRDCLTTDEIAIRMEKSTQTIRWHLAECRSKISLRCTHTDLESELF